MNFRMLVPPLVVVWTCGAHAQAVDRFNVKVYQESAFAPGFVNPLPGPLAPEYEERVEQVAFSLDLSSEPLAIGEILVVMAEVYFRQEEPCGVVTAGIGCGVYLGTQATYNPFDIECEDEDGCGLSDPEYDLPYEIANKNVENLSITNQPDSFNLSRQTAVKVGTHRVTAENSNPARQFVNVYTYVLHECYGDEIYVNNSGEQNSQLTVVRFTPVVPPLRGWELNLLPPTSAELVEFVNATQSTNPDIVYQIDLDAGANPAFWRRETV